VSALDTSGFEGWAKENDVAGDPMPEAKSVDLGVLDKRRFDFDNPPKRPESIFKLGGQVIATPGNLAVVQSQVKSGKSAFLGAMIASTISQDPLADFLGISTAQPNGKAIVHFDTEQSRYDADQLIRRALRRGSVDRPPPGYYSPPSSSNSGQVLKNSGYAACLVAFRALGVRKVARRT
jgi:hypothetical protein